MNNKAKQILELEAKRKEVRRAGVRDTGDFEVGIRDLAVDLAREVERDYVRKDRLLEFIEKLSKYDSVPAVLFALSVKINSGELES